MRFERCARSGNGGGDAPRAAAGRGHGLRQRLQDLALRGRQPAREGTRGRGTVPGPGVAAVLPLQPLNLL